MRADDSVHLDETLGVPSGFEPSHSSLPLTRRLMRVLRPVVQVPVLPVSDAGHHDSFRCGVAAQFIGNDHAWMPMAGRPQQLAKEPHGRETVALWLHQNIDDNTVLIDGPPEIMRDAIDIEEDLVQMPFVAGSGTPSPQAIGVLLAELFAPAPDRFIADHHAACRHHLLDIPKAHREPVVEPNGIRDDLFRKSMATVRVVRHSFSIPSDQVPQLEPGISLSSGKAYDVGSNLVLHEGK